MNVMREASQCKQCFADSVVIRQRARGLRAVRCGANGGDGEPNTLSCLLFLI